MNGINYFCYGDFRSADHNIILTAPPPEIIAERDVEIVSIAGRSGDLIRDNKRYKNVTVPFELAVIPPDDGNMREIMINAIDKLNPAADYRRLTTTYDPGHFRIARVASGITVESIVEQAGIFKIAFDCNPQRFLVDGDFSVKFTAPGSLYNPTTEIAQPIITIRGSGSGRLTVGDITVEVKQLEDQITLDSDLQDAYRQVGDGAPENKNSCIYAPDFPVLVPGKNTISWTGGITSVEIIPRWWTL